MPGARCARSLACSVRKHTSVITTVTPENTRHSPRNGFNGFLRALPGDRAFLSPSSADIASANLTPASRRQDHTTSPSASVRFVKRTARVHRIPSHVRDDRETPLRGTGPNRNSPVSTWPSSEISEIPKLVPNPCKVRPDNRLSIPKASTSVFSFTGRPRRRYDSDKRRPSNCTTCEPTDCIDLGNSHLGAFTLLCPASPPPVPQFGSGAKRKYFCKRGWTAN
jgi:hypothetical protein